MRRGAGEGTLDQSLKRQALAAGVTIRFGQAPPQLPPPCIRTPGPGRCDALDVGYVFETDMADGVFAVLSERLAPKGYAYLLVCRGWGTVASCLFEDYGNAREYRERTRRFFERKAGLRMQNPRAFGGTGNVRARPLVRAGDTLYAGEAAGLQDALWGFGMRCALVSGHMAGAGAPGRASRPVRPFVPPALHRVPPDLDRQPLLLRAAWATAATRAFSTPSSAPTTRASGCAGSTHRGSGRRCGSR